jgi:hypothetical protein
MHLAMATTCHARDPRGLRVRAIRWRRHAMARGVKRLARPRTRGAIQA